MRRVFGSRGGLFTIVIALAIATPFAKGSAEEAAESAVTFRPFDKTSLPLLRALPSGIPDYELSLYRKLNQDDNELVICLWKDWNLDAARTAANNANIMDLDPQSIKADPLTKPLINGLMKPIVPLYYGAIDKSDLWISKYWGRGAFTLLIKVFPRSIKDALIQDPTATSVDKEGLTKYFRTPSAVLIENRIEPYKTTGPEGIIFAANVSFVKFKELYGAAQSYCRSKERSGDVEVAGWLRSCDSSTSYSPGAMKFSNVQSDVDTIMHVGFVCK